MATPLNPEELAKLQQEKAKELQELRQRIMKEQDPSKAPKTPPPNLQQHAIQAMKELLFDGKLSEFYNTWSEFSKATMDLPNLGRTIAGFQQLYGKIDRVGNCSAPKQEPTNPYFWGMYVDLYVGPIEYFAFVTYNHKFEVGTFSLGKKCIYHPPEYIKEKRFEEIILSENETYFDILFTKPLVPRFPVAIYIHPFLQLDVDGRMGYTFTSRDYDYLPSANIGTCRFVIQEPPKPTVLVDQATRALEKLMQRDDVSNYFLILHSHAVFFLQQILMKFSGIFAGVILVNPGSEPLPGFPVTSLTLDSIPKDIPVLVLEGGYDQFLKPAEKAWWKDAASKLGLELVNYDTCDHFLMACDHVPDKMEYSMYEKHMSDVPLRKMASWIRDIDTKHQ